MLETLFKIIHSDRLTDELTFAFINKERNLYLPPEKKVFRIKNKETFLKELRKCLQKLGKDYFVES
jgi:hypothetical protein